MQPIGVFGGTFDPIHFGHLRLAEEMAEGLGLSQVRFIPAGQPPHRGAPRTAASHRLEMVRRAIAGNPRFEVDAREVQRPDPSYTVDTLTALRAELGNEQPLWLLLGADAFSGLPSWHQWRQLFELANIVVAARPGRSSCNPDWQSAGGIETGTIATPGAQRVGYGPRRRGRYLQNMTPLDISATAHPSHPGTARQRTLSAARRRARLHSQHQLYTHL